jgi:F-box-like
MVSFSSQMIAATIDIRSHSISRLCSLPEEVLICILSLLHPATLVACRAVSSHLHLRRPNSIDPLNLDAPGL